MATLLFKCPSTGMTVQGWLADEHPDEADTYEAVACPACTYVHFINRETGRTLNATE